MQHPDGRDKQRLPRPTSVHVLQTLISRHPHMGRPPFIPHRRMRRRLQSILEHKQPNKKLLSALIPRNVSPDLKRRDLHRKQPQNDPRHKILQSSLLRLRNALILERMLRR
jgi:hypothetical protein